MTLDKWEPFGEMRRMDEALSRLWRGLDFRRPFEMLETWDVPLDIVDHENEIEVKASLPDIDPARVDVSVTDGVLTIKGESSSEKEDKKGNYLLRERRSGSFYRAVRLPDSVDSDRARSSYAKGVLTVTLPKVVRRKAQKIKVEHEPD
jgi:HSP20 family protein